MDQEAVQEFTAGAVAGLAALVVGHPLDTLKTLIQNSTGEAKVSDIVRNLRKSGMSSFFRGLSMPFYSYALVNAVLFSTYNSTYRKIDPHGQYQLVTMAFSGLVAGGVQLIPAVPVEVIKISMQRDAVKPGTKVSVVGYCRQIVRERGVLGLYAGFSAHAARDMPACALYFFSYSYIRDYLWRNTHLGAIVSSFWAGAFSGCLSWMLTVPQDVIKTRLQAGTDKSVSECIASLKKTGYRSFFRGFGMVCLRAFVVNAFTFLAYELVIMELKGHTRREVTFPEDRRPKEKKK